jgi:hypothetical protein
MFKVIVERPRASGRTPTKTPTRAAVARAEMQRIMHEGYEEDEDGDAYTADNTLKTFEPIKSRYDDHRSLNENLAPLLRFLEKSIGRPWDEVYSEVREHLRLDSAVQLHVVQHLNWTVTEKTYMGEDGHVYATDRSWHRYNNNNALDLPNPFSRHNYYVHPETKLLCRQPHLSKKARRAKEVKVLSLDKYRQFRLIDGKWMVVELADVEAGNPFQARKGFVLKYDYKTQKTYSYPNYDFPDVLFPNGLKGEKRYDEYGDYNLYATVIRDVGAREQKVLEALLKKEAE